MKLINPVASEWSESNYKMFNHMKKSFLLLSAKRMRCVTTQTQTGMIQGLKSIIFLWPRTSQLKYAHHAFLLGPESKEEVFCWIMCEKLTKRRKMLFTINCCDMCGCVGHYDSNNCNDVSISIGILRREKNSSDTTFYHTWKMFANSNLNLKNKLIII